MKLILKIFVLSFFVILLSGCTNDTNTNYYPYSNLSNNKDVGYVRSSDSLEDISLEETDTEPTQRTCCKYCSKGKACGDSCISRSYTCHKAPGCACDM